VIFDGVFEAIMWILKMFFGKQLIDSIVGCLLVGSSR
jgi:hypothetical protein